jgi:uncharacterized protein involved in exopolysaccharide biosynthesis
METQQRNHSANTMDLIAGFSLLWNKKYTILAVAMASGIVGGTLAFLATPKYEVSMLLHPVTHNIGGNSEFGALRGLTSIVGINIKTTVDDKLIALATLQSRHLITSFIDQEKLLPTLFHSMWDDDESDWILDDGDIPPTLWDGHRLFVKKVMRVTEDPQSGIITLSITWTDPNLAVKWAEGLVEYTNNYIKQTARSEHENNLEFLEKQMALTSNVEVRNSISQMVLKEMEQVMLANVSIEYALKILDPAVAPPLNKFSSPNRQMIIILAIFLGGVVSGFGVVFMRRIRNSKP